MKRLILIITTLCIISCSDTTVEPETVETGRREEIAFSMSTDSHFTRSAATRSMVAFAADTRIVMRMECHNSYEKPNTRYTRTTAITNGSATYTSASGTEDYNSVKYATTADQRYWNEAFAKSFDASVLPSQLQNSTKASQIEVFAVAIPGLDNSTLLPDGILASGAKDGEESPYGWGTNADHAMQSPWSVTTDMSKIANEDLVYSNNIREGGESGVYRFTNGNYVPNLGTTVTGDNNFFDGRMLFSDGNPDRGHLIFKHALTRLTVKLTEGERFDGVHSADDFQFTARGTNPVSNIEMLKAPRSGTLNIKTGVWSNKSNADVLKFAKTDGGDTDASGTYLAQILPGYKFAKGSETVALQFTIDGDTYEITQGEIFAALKNAVIPPANQATATSITMEAGANYTLNIKVNKYKVSVIIDAMIAPWEFGGTQEETFTKW